MSSSLELQNTHLASRCVREDELIRVGAARPLSIVEAACLDLLVNRLPTQALRGAQVGHRVAPLSPGRRYHEMNSMKKRDY